MYFGLSKLTMDKLRQRKASFNKMGGECLGWFWWEFLQCNIEFYAVSWGCFLKRNNVMVEELKV